MSNARIAEGLRMLAEGLEKQDAKPEWYDQITSPLGKRAHLDLVRTGKIAGSKVGQRVLARREHVDAYIIAHTVVPVGTKDDDDTEAERLLARMARRTA